MLHFIKCHCLVNTVFFFVFTLHVNKSEHKSKSEVALLCLLQIFSLILVCRQIKSAESVVFTKLFQVCVLLHHTTEDQSPNQINTSRTFLHF